MQDLKKSVLEEFDKRFLGYDGHFIKDDGSGFCKNVSVGDFKQFIVDAIDKSFEAGRQQGLSDNNKKGESWRKGYQQGCAEINLKILELLSQYALKTKDIKTLDLIEEIQKEVINLK